MNPLAKTLTHALAAAGLAGAAITPAMANPFVDGFSERVIISVPTGDLDLNSAAGQRTLDRRIQTAARQACRSVSVKTGTRIIDQEVQTCLAKARANAKEQVAALMNNERRGG
jgi:UrcA family protein